MPAELTDQKQLSTVIDYLRDTNATEELLLDEVSSHRDVLASTDSKKFIREVPTLLEYIGEVLSDMMLLSKDIAENGSRLIQNQREDAEEQRLNEKNNKKKDKGSSDVTFGDLKGAVGNSPLMLLLGAGTFLIGNIVGAIEQLAIFIKAAFKETKLGKAISGLVKTLSEKITSVIDFSKDIVGKIVNGVKGTFTKLFSADKGIFSFVGKIAEFFGKIGNFIKGIFSPAIKEIGDFVGKGVKFFTGGKVGFLDDFGKLFSQIGMFFKIGKSFGKAVTRLLGKLALPLTIIIGIWDTITGAIEGYKAEGILGAIKGAIGGLLESLVGSLLDLIKSGISWVAGALGFENIEKFLDSFSFSKILKDGVSGIVDSIAYFFEYLGDTFSLDKFKDAWSKFSVLGIMAMIAGGLADMLKGAVSWILTFFGQTDWAVALDSFSFQDLYKGLLEKGKGLIKSISDFVGDVITKVSNWFMELPNKIGEFFSNASEKVAEFGVQMADMSQLFMKKILQSVLPRKDNSQPWYSIPNLTSAAIPDSVYEFAGINPETGEIIPSPKELPVEKITPVPIDTASAVSMNPAASAAPTIINNVSRGGDVHNVSNSNVNQNVNGAAGPIITGSAMGLYSF